MSTNTLKTFIEKSVIKTFEIGQSPTVVLTIVGAAGWLIAMFAQMNGIKNNKALSEDKKKVLLKQEKADGLANTGLFIVLTKGMSEIMTKQVEKFKIIPKQIKDDAIKAVKLIDPNYCGDLKDVFPIPKKITKQTQIQKTLINEQETLIENIRKFKSGIGVIASVIGSVAATNIIAPLVRNKMSQSAKQNTTNYPNTPKTITPYKKTTPLTPKSFMKRRFQVQKRRWYDKRETTLAAMKLLKELDPISQKIISSDIVNIANSIKTVRKEQEYTPLSLGIKRVLGLYQTNNSRRWYDNNEPLSLAFKTISTLPDEDFANIMQGICHSIKS